MMQNATSAQIRPPPMEVLILGRRATKKQKKPTTKTKKIHT
jgi:hypothetical protein